MRLKRYSLLALILILVAACSFDTPSNSLAVSITQNDAGNYHIADCRVLDHPYKKSAGRQGTFRVQLLDNDGKVIQEIGFGTLNVSTNESGNSEINFIIPLLPNLKQIAVYKLDGSSGHYRLDSAHPLLTWTMPDSVGAQNH